MPDVSATLMSMQPKRGRGPGVLNLRTDEGELLELTTFDPGILRDAAENSGTKGQFTYTEKENTKDPTKPPYKNLVGMKLEVSDQKSSESTVDPLGGDSSPVEVQIHAEVLSQNQTGPVVALRPVQGVSSLALDPMKQLELGAAIAKRRYELILELLRERFKEGTHFMDGKTFGSDKPVLLQPGAHAILQVCGFGVDTVIVSGPLEAPADTNTKYTILTKATVTNIDGRVLGNAFGSASSHIWSNKAGRYVLRAVDPDKSHNSAIKMSIKRAVVAVCRQTTPASEIFCEDLEEGGYHPKDNDPDQPKKGGLFKRR